MDDNQELEGRKTAGQVWTGRYQVRAEVSYRDRKGRPGSMHIITFQPDMPVAEVSALLEPLGFTPESVAYKRLVSQARDTFSKEQAEELAVYLDGRRGTQARISPAPLPSPALIGASAIPSLPSFRDGVVYRLHLEPGYRLPFKVESINIKTYIAMAKLFQEMKEQF